MPHRPNMPTRPDTNHLGGSQRVVRFAFLLAVVVNLLFSHVALAAIYKSTNGGESWSLVELSLIDVHSLAVDPNDEDVIYAGNHFDGIWISTDGGDDWGPTDGNGTNLEYVDHLEHNGIYIYAATLDLDTNGTTAGAGEVYRSSNEGNTWTVVGSPHGTSTLSLTFNGANLFTANSGSGAKRLLSPLNGAWSAIGGFDAVSTSAASTIIAPYIGHACTATNPVGQCGGVIKLHDDIPLEEDCVIPWTCWDPASDGLPSPVDVEDLASDGVSLYAGTFEQGIYELIGSTWSSLGLDGISIHDILPSQSTRPMVVSTIDGVFRRESNVWVPSNSGLDLEISVPYALVRDPSDPDVLFLGTWEASSGLLDTIFSDGFESGALDSWSVAGRSGAVSNREELRLAFLEHFH